MEDSKKKWILFAALAVIVIGLVAVLIVTVFKPAGPAAPSENSVSAVIPDGEASRMEDSKSKVYRGSTESYFAELDAADAAREDISLLSSDGTAPALTTAPITGSAAPEDAVSRVFSPAPSAPAPAATSAPARHSSGGGGATSRPMTEDERLDYDRRRAEMVRDVLVGGPDASASDAAGAAPEDRPEPIDLSSVGASDGIISTLDDDQADATVGYGVRPFKCMFVRDQKLTSGQRVTVRLLEDYVEGNVRIPANTHLAAICKIGDRLELQIRSLEMSGRIVPLALDAYDTDGLPGIYCPETSSVKNTREVSRDALTAGTTAFGGLVGDIANTVIRTGASIARNASGELSVSVVSGYEFYLVKSEKR
jgi:hypothetical protein